MKELFFNKLNDWYKSYLERYEIIKETDSEVLLYVAARENKQLRFEIVRIFMVGNNVEISIDESITETNMDGVLKLIRTVARVI